MPTVSKSPIIGWNNQLIRIIGKLADYRPIPIITPLYSTPFNQPITGNTESRLNEPLRLLWAHSILDRHTRLILSVTQYRVESRSLLWTRTTLSNHTPVDQSQTSETAAGSLRYPETHTGISPTMSQQPHISTLADAEVLKAQKDWPWFPHSIILQ